MEMVLEMSYRDRDGGCVRDGIVLEIIVETETVLETGIRIKGGDVLDMRTETEMETVLVMSSRDRNEVVLEKGYRNRERWCLR